MRGKVASVMQWTTQRRITPAYAGKSIDRKFKSDFQRDHPRVCGEKHLYDKMFKADQGSPPRMRGKACSPSHRFALHGITPAYAGKSLIRRVFQRVIEDHPRVCGEK